MHVSLVLVWDVRLLAIGMPYDVQAALLLWMSIDAPAISIKYEINGLIETYHELYSNDTKL